MKGKDIRLSLEKKRRMTKKKRIQDNKFHKGAQDGKHYWLTPPKLYQELNEIHGFDFDPCPYPLPKGFDGLTCDWGSSNYVNPPFGSILHEGKRKGATAWVRKAIEEAGKGKDVVFVFPIDKWVLMMIEAGAEVTNLGDVRWHSIEDGKAGKGTGRHIAKFVLKGSEKNIKLGKRYLRKQDLAKKEMID